MTGRLVYDPGRERWTVVDDGGHELRELHCGDVLTVRDCSDDGADWLSVRVELDGCGWYMVTQAGEQRDDFELMDVQL